MRTLLAIGALMLLPPAVQAKGPDLPPQARGRLMTGLQPCVRTTTVLVDEATGERALILVWFTCRHRYTQARRSV